MKTQYLVSIAGAGIEYLVFPSRCTLGVTLRFAPGRHVVLRIEPRR
jgi:hypothetical protein